VVRKEDVNGRRFAGVGWGRERGSAREESSDAAHALVHVRRQNQGLLHGGAAAWVPARLLHSAIVPSQGMGGIRHSIHSPPLSGF
jgi:hypothetical protein